MVGGRELMSFVLPDQKARVEMVGVPGQVRRDPERRVDEDHGPGSGVSPYTTSSISAGSTSIAPTICQSGSSSRGGSCSTCCRTNRRISAALEGPSLISNRY